MIARTFSIGLSLSLILSSVVLGAGENPTPSWIWTAGKVADDQVLFFRKTFELPADIKGINVQFWGSCDNVINANINGQAIGFSTEWAMPMSFDVTQWIKPGKNVIALRGTN